ncbi:MAG TPA: inositol monophosphatase family protein [Salinisphaeraceae bacterium]|nr:inositol monophosphatase family protein [Salinisphaeraceae bacterium]
MSKWKPYLESAIDAARAAEAVIRAYYRTDIEVMHKADASPVTVADIEAERAIKGVLGTDWPAHGFYGEELGQERSDSDYLWLIDPIDGTKSFVRGYPFFSTQIALMYRGELVLGVSNAPFFGAGELACAAQGAGATLNEASLQVSAIDDLAATSLSIGNSARLAASPAWTEVGQLINRVSRIRGYGDFYHYHLLASGRVDVVLESDVNILDIAALTVIVREAGGDITTLGGKPIDLQATSVFATNARLRAAVAPYLAGWTSG